MRHHGGNNMFIKDWKHEVFTIPNYLSLFRLLLIPVYTLLYLNAGDSRESFLSAVILGVSCLTDMVDGQIARRFNMISNVGKVLDPLADKLTQLSLVICLSVRYPALRGVLILFVIKELFQVTSVYIMFRRGKILPGALLAGKICTTVMFLSFLVLILLPDLPLMTITAIAIVDAVFLAASFIAYYLAIFSKHNKLQDIQE